MAGKIIGRFYFKLSDNGNLLGEYSNENLTGCDVEAAKRISGYPIDVSTTELFIGEYNSTWTEGGKVESANLKITQKANSDGLFSVIWSNTKGVPMFTGEAMIVDKILIGNYQSK